MPSPNAPAVWSSNSVLAASTVTASTVVTASVSPLLLSGNPTAIAHQSVLFIDAGVENAAQIAAQIAAQPAAIAIVLDPTQDAIAQMTQVLSGLRQVATIQVFSHGGNGGLQLGASWVDGQTLSSHTTQLKSWATALTADADILLYGCNVAQDLVGKAFVDQLAQITGADVAASDDRTGRDGDWRLEYQTGAIDPHSELARSIQASYQGNLPVFEVSNANDDGTGSLREAINEAFYSYLDAPDQNAAPPSVITFVGTMADSTPDTINLSSSINIGKQFVTNLRFEGVGNTLIFAGTGSDAAFVIEDYYFSALTSFDPPTPTPTPDSSPDFLTFQNLILDGNNQRSLIRMNSGALILSGVTIQNGLAQGGDGGDGDNGGGGGAGLGGGVLLYGGIASISNSVFTGNVAQGGAGGNGGYGFSSTVTLSSSNGGGGGGLNGNNGLDTSSDSRVGAFGQGGGGAKTTAGQPYVASIGGGNGGFGAGGGGAYDSNGGAISGRSGGFGGDGARSGGNAGYISTGGGGGGAGLGGALFVNSNVKLNLADVTFTNNSASGGIGGGLDQEKGGDGKGKGGAIFNDGADITVTNVTYTNNAASNDINVIGDNNNVYGVYSGILPPTPPSPPAPPSPPTPPSPPAPPAPPGLGDQNTSTIRLANRNQTTQAIDIEYRDRTTQTVQTKKLVYGESFGTLAGQVVKLAEQWQLIDAGDRNRDGITDFIVQNPVDDEAVVWSIGDQGVVNAIVAVRSQSGQTLKTGRQDWAVVGTGDIDQDGITDLVWQNQTTDETAFWYMQSDGLTIKSYDYLRDSKGDILKTTNPQWKILNVSDLDGDGDADLLLQLPELNQTAIVRLQAQTFVDSQYLAPRPTANLVLQAVADRNRDGIAEIYWKNPSSGQMTVQTLKLASNIWQGESFRVMNEL